MKFERGDRVIFARLATDGGYSYDNYAMTVGNEYRVIGNDDSDDTVIVINDFSDEWYMPEVCFDLVKGSDIKRLIKEFTNKELINELEFRMTKENA